MASEVAPRHDLFPPAADLRIPARGVARLAQFPPSDRWEGAVHAACAEARGMVRPRARWRPLTEPEADELFSSETPVAGLARRGPCWAFVATVGGELERRVREHFAAGRYLEGVLLDAAGSTAVESLADLVQGVAADGADAVRFSPGYCSWAMESQRRLLGLLAPEDLGVRLLPSLLMEPLKSVSGIVVAGDRAKLRVPAETCRACEARGCSRRSPEG